MHSLLEPHFQCLYNESIPSHLIDAHPVHTCQPYPKNTPSQCSGSIIPFNSASVFIQEQGLVYIIVASPALKWKEGGGYSSDCGILQKKSSVKRFPSDWGGGDEGKSGVERGGRSEIPLIKRDIIIILSLALKRYPSSRGRFGGWDVYTKSDL